MTNGYVHFKLTFVRWTEIHTAVRLFSVMFFSFLQIIEFQFQAIMEEKVRMTKKKQKDMNENPSEVKFSCRGCSKHVCTGEDIQIIENMHRVNVTTQFRYQLQFKVHFYVILNLLHMFSDIIRLLWFITYFSQWTFHSKRKRCSSRATSRLWDQWTHSMQGLWAGKYISLILQTFFVRIVKRKKNVLMNFQGIVQKFGKYSYLLSCQEQHKLHGAWQHSEGLVSMMVSHWQIKRTIGNESRAVIK